MELLFQNAVFKASKTGVGLAYWKEHLGRNVRTFNVRLKTERSWSHVGKRTQRVSQASEDGEGVTDRGDVLETESTESDGSVRS